MSARRVSVLRAAMREAVESERDRLHRGGSDAATVRASLTARAVELVASLTSLDDVGLGQACRGVLDALAQVPPDAGQSVRDPVDAEGQGSGLSDLAGAAPLVPPSWASRSVPDDGGVVHEAVSRLCPTVKVGGAHGWVLTPTTVGLSAMDLLIDGQWVRTLPTVQVEGGAYSLEGALQLRAAVDGFLAVIGGDDARSAAS